MRKVVVYELLSLDGVAEQPDEFITDFDDVMRENLGRVIATQDSVLLGRRTYDDWAAFWPTSDIEPFASFINGVEKFVVTSTTPGEPGPTPRSSTADLLEFVTELKAAVRRRHRGAREHRADPIAARAGPGRRTAAGDRPGPAHARSKALRQGVVEAADSDSPRHLSVRLPIARLPGRELTRRRLNDGTARSTWPWPVVVRFLACVPVHSDQRFPHPARVEA